MLKDITSFQVNAKVINLVENGITTFVDIDLRLPYDSHLAAKIEVDTKEHRTLVGEGLWVPKLARNAGVASRLVKALAYVAKQEEVDRLTLHATSAYTIMTACTMLGEQNLCCVEYLGSQKTKDCSTSQAIADLTTEKTMGVDITYNVNDQAIETEEAIFFKTFEDI
jgi:hypothetical protein